jgi:hypothetical protein
MTVHAICPICEKRIRLHSRKDFESFTGLEAVEHIKTEHPESVTDFGVPYYRIEFTD